MIDGIKRPKKTVKPLSNLQASKTHINITPKPSFKTPEEVAADDDLLEASQNMNVIGDDAPVKASFSERLKAFRVRAPQSVTEWAIAGTLVLVLVAVAFVVFTKRDAPAVATIKPAAKVVKKAEPKPVTVASTLSGVQVYPSYNQLPVTGVMIENSTDARPQSGLSQASVVFEAIAEGGVTRFLALYQDNQAADVGPIRSARPYYLQWLLGFDAGYAHVGGSPEALASIKSLGVKDLDQFYNGGSYHRVNSRQAPHNVYTGIPNLVALQNSKGYNTSTFTGFTRKKEAPSKAPTAKSIDLNISGPVYNVHYDYDAVTNSYKRSEGGAAHIDAANNAQLSPKVVVAMVMSYSVENDGYHSSYNVIGTGSALIFQDGDVTTGTWNKTANNSQITFTDAAGNPLALNPGQTWLTAITATNKATYAP